jgi:hypothetical protein
MTQAMTAWEEHQHRRASGELSRVRSYDRLNRLPKFCIANIYRALVTAPRNEDKSDMVGVLWSRYGPMCRPLWEMVSTEEDYAARCKAAKKAGQPKPRI